MKMIIEVPDGIVGESIKTAHNLEMNFENYVTDALNEANEKWDERARRDARDAEAFTPKSFDGLEGFAEKYQSIGLESGVKKGDVIRKISDHESLYTVLDVFSRNGVLSQMYIIDKKGNPMFITSANLYKYEILPF